MVSNQIGYAVGWAGTILKTSDGGQNWNQIKSGKLENFYSLTFLNPDTGLVVGAKGVIIKTKNGGFTWDTIYSGGAPTFYDILAINSLTFIAVGANGTIIKTTDGGSNWAACNSGTSSTLYAVSFASAVGGFAVGDNGTILVTSDGGLNWDAVSSGLANRFYDVVYNGTNVFVTGSSTSPSSPGTIWRSLDNGINWTRNNINSASYFSSIKFLSETIGYATCYGVNNVLSNIAKTTDGGLTWSLINNGVSYALNSISFSNQFLGAAVGRYGTIFRTYNGGLTWIENSKSSSYQPLSSVSFSNEIYGMACASTGDILYTSNGGSSWIKKNSISGATCTDIFLHDQFSATVVGMNGLIQRTGNSGNFWTVQNSGTSNDLFGVFFHNLNEGIAVGRSGVIRRTTNGGQTWLVVSSGVSASLTDVYFINPQVGYVSCSDGKVLKTTNGGITWSQQSTGYSVYLSNIFFIDANVGYCCGNQGVLLKTVNGGATWSPLFTGTNQSIKNIRFSDAQKGVYTSFNGIFSTVDGGTTWNLQNFGIGNSMSAMTYKNGNWTIVGNGGTIIRSGSVGIPCNFTGTLSVPTTTINCINTSATLTASGGTSYAWSNGQTSASITVNPSTTTTYSVIITNQNGCKDTVSQQIVVNNTPPAQPTISFFGSNTICQGSSKTLSSSANSGNQWFKDGVPIDGETGNSLTVTISGIYSVRVTASNGCSSTSSTVQIQVEANPIPPTITYQGSTNFCSGSSLVLTSSSPGNNQWYKDGLPIVGQGGTSLNVNTSGNYYVAVTNLANCTAQSLSVIIQVSPTPLISQNPNTQTLVIGGTGIFVVKTSTPNSSYLWQTDVGSGFSNVFDVGQYSGSNTDSLKVSNLVFANNNQKFRAIVSNSGCRDTSEIANLLITTGVMGLELPQVNLLLPNPVVRFAKLLYLDLPACVSIFDLRGNLIVNRWFYPNQETNLGDLPSGLYLFKADSGRVPFWGKFVRE